MRCARVVGSLLALCALLAPGVAHAQIFSVYTPPKPTETTTAGKADKFRRLHIGTFLALWDSPPFQGNIGVQSVSGGPPMRVNLEASIDASPLITADYFIFRNLSVGGWWNPISGDADQTIAGTKVDLRFFDNFYDFHATWYAPERVGFLPRWLTSGLSVQGGYSIQNIDLDAGPGTVLFENGVRTSDIGTTLTSPNVWVTKRFNLGTPLRGREDRPISLFVQGGRYFSGEFETAWNIIGGATFVLNPKLSLSASYWRVMPRQGDDQSRISLGLTARY
jgi:hypothetical protein